MLSKEADEDDDDDCLHRMITFGMLFTLCLEYSEDPGDPFLANRYTVLSRMFLAKLETAMSELPLILVPSAKAVNALVVAVRHHLALLQFHFMSTDTA